MASRPTIVTVVAVIQTAVAVAAALAVLLLFYQNYSLPPGNTPEETQEIHMGLRVALSAAGICAVITVFIAWALWKRWRWGWWLGTVFYLLAVASILYGPIADHERMDMDDISVALVFLLLTVLLFLPPVRRFYLARGTAGEPAVD